MNALLVLTRVATVVGICLLPALAQSRASLRTGVPRRVQRSALDEGRERRLRMDAARRSCARRLLEPWMSGGLRPT